MNTPKTEKAIQAWAQSGEITELRDLCEELEEIAERMAEEMEGVDHMFVSVIDYRANFSANDKDLARRALDSE